MFYKMKTTYTEKERRKMEKTKMEGKTNYGNWVPEKMLYLMFGLAAVFLVIAVAAKAVLHKPATEYKCRKGRFVLK